MLIIQNTVIFVYDNVLSQKRINDFAVINRYIYGITLLTKNLKLMKLRSAAFVQTTDIRLNLATITIKPVHYITYL